MGFAHVTIRASDRPASERFYRTVLGAIGVEPTHRREDLVAWKDFAIVGADAEHPPTRHLHVAFATTSREQVDRFWHAGVAAGYREDGAPGVRPQYGPDYYGGFLLDPDGNSAEAIHSTKVAPPGQIDHLWIGVRDLDATEMFYNLLARYTGFDSDHAWPAGLQFRREDSTFSVLHDGRPPTESLHLAFPAPDRRTVDEFHHAVTSAGYRSNGAPGERAQYGPGYYAGFVFDPDGTNIELVLRG